MFRQNSLSLLSRSLLVVISCLSLAATLFAERLPIKIYTSADGLGSSASFNLVRDARGFIWLCSRDGLVRFDGYRFTTYRVGDEFADPSVFKILPDRSGRYWINLNRGTDYRLIARGENELLAPIADPHGANDTRVPINAEPVGDTPLPVFEDSDGTLWTANSKSLLIMRERPDGKFDFDPVVPPAPGNPIDGFSYLVIDHAADKNGFWLGTQWGLVRRFRDGRMLHYSIKPEGNQDLVRFVAEDNQGRVWLGRSGSLIILKTVPADVVEASISARVTPGRMTADGTPELPTEPGDAFEFPFADLLRSYNAPAINSSEFLKPELFSMIAGRGGKVWMATNHGVVMFDGQRFRHYTSRHGLASNTINALVQGNEGHIWMASDGGLHRLNPRGLTSYDEADGLERARITALYETPAGELHVVSGNFNVSALRGSLFVRARPSISADEIALWQSNAGFLDSRGDWWVITSKNLYRYSGVKRVEDLAGRAPTQVYNESNGLLGSTSLKIFEDSGGNIWVSTFVTTARRGLTRIDRRTGEFSYFEAKDGLPETPTSTSFVEDETGTPWFGFNEGGVGRYKDGRIQMLRAGSLPPGGVTDLFRDSKGRIWVASTRGGLSRTDNPTSEHPEFIRYTTANGLASNNIRAIGEDRLGQIYIGTVRGLDRLNPETGQIKYYGTSDGLASDFVNVVYRDRAGTMWIGTLNGLSKLVPEEDDPVQSLPVLISGLRIGDQDYLVSPLGQSEVFVPDQEPSSSNMQIDFLSVGSTDTASTRYQYMLEGIDEDWSKPTDERTVTLANLPPGGHRFLVRSVISGVVMSAKPAAVHFTVLRPVWQRWWFLLLVSVAIAATSYFVYRYRLAQLIKLERVRTRIATDLHDDIGSSLSQIAILSEVARHKAGENGAAEPLRRIAETSRDLVDSMSDIVWAINPHKDHLTDLVQRMRRFAGDAFDATDVGYIFNFDEATRDIAMGADLRREVYLIFKECVSNIAKHSGADEVKMVVDVAADRLRISIHDNGRGFDVAEAFSGEIKGYGGNGLLNMKRRAERLGGDFSIESGPGTGTSVVFSIPTGAHLLEGASTGRRSTRN